MAIALAAMASLGLAGCGASTDTPPANFAKSKPVCVVLSVGAQDGLAHIGVLEALKERGVKPECVYGNSMGALAGGLYASNPDRDLRERYRSLAHRYEEKAKEEAGQAALGGCLLFSLIFGGFTAPACGMGAALGGSSINERDLKRLLGVLEQELHDVDIDDLPVQFATWYQKLHASPALVTVSTGKLASAIIGSIGNPLIFSDVKVSPGARLDPGLDRASAVPLEDACKLRPDAHFIVSNVTGKPLYFSSNMTCSYEEIVVDVPNTELARALLARSPDFEQIVDAGFAAASKSLSPRQATSRPPQRALISKTGG